jgi:16S rRNA (cytosine967-C5)-methyltransferase
MAGARHAAAEVLLALEAGRDTLATEVDRARRGLTDERDRALLLELASGVMRWRAELDAALTPCVTRPLPEIHPAVLTVLRLAAYQLRHLDRIPPHAVLNESVELARTLGEPRAAGFVNAALRTLLRRRDKRDLPARPAATTDLKGWSEYLSTTLSHPAWLVERWIARHGVEAAERWCAFDNQAPTVCVHAAISDDDLGPALTEAGVEAVASAFVNGSWRLPPGALGRLPAPMRARLLVQDEASLIVAHAVGARPHESVLDLCAAPGGKSIVMAADMAKSGRLVSCDTRSRRVRLLRAALRQAQVPAFIVCLNGTRPLPFAQAFDRVLVDAPCSGLGTLARDPDIRWRRQPADLDRLAATQLELLRSASSVVKPGGHLVYATCSGEPEETAGVVDAFLSLETSFARLPGAGLASLESLKETNMLLDDRGDLRTWPFVHTLDAFYAAVLVRREAT